MEDEYTPRKIGKIAGLATAGLLTLITGFRSCTTVPAGHVSVLDTFGSVNEKELEPGIRLKNPLSSSNEMSIRTQEAKETIKVPTSQGMMATLDIAVQYHLMSDKADSVYKTLGTNYQDVAIVSPLRNVTRDVIANHPPEDLYNQNREKISVEIDTALRKTYSERGIQLERVLLRDVGLPDEVTNAIDRKIRAKQEADQMEYTLQKEEKESERKIVEAKGIAEAQKVIAESLSPEYLQWKYITTLESLTNSDNTTFVITPYDQKLIPMIPLDKK